MSWKGFLKSDPSPNCSSGGKFEGKSSPHSTPSPYLMFALLHFMAFTLLSWTLFLLLSGVADNLPSGKRRNMGDNGKGEGGFWLPLVNSSWQQWLLWLRIFTIQVWGSVHVKVLENKIARIGHGLSEAPGSAWGGDGIAIHFQSL